MGNGSVAFHRDVGYDFYLVREGLNSKIEFECIPMPKGGTFHRELSDEVIIALPRAEDDKQTLHRKLEDAYRNLTYGRK